MVHLTYVQNPFSESIFASISEYAYEHDFYDCINKRFIDEPFKNLEYTFHMYMLTGDNSEWIGYVLFSNELLVSSLRYHAYMVIKSIVESLELNEFSKNQISDMIEESKGRASIFDTITRTFDILTKHYTLEEVEALRKKYFEVLSKTEEYFAPFYYLDIVIALPIDEKKVIREENTNADVDSYIERKYYGFIQETLSLVEKELDKNFKANHIILNRDGENAFLIETSSFIKKDELAEQLLIK